MSGTSKTVRRFPALWLAAAWLLVHGLVATLLPRSFAPVSTLFIVLAELAAIYACVQTSHMAGRSMRTRWWLLAFGILFHAIAMILNLRTELIGAVESNPIPGLQILFSTLYGVPLLLAVSMQFDPRAFRPIRIVNLFLSLALAALFYVQVFSVATIHGSSQTRRYSLHLPSLRRARSLSRHRRNHPSLWSRPAAGAPLLLHRLPLPLGEHHPSRHSQPHSDPPRLHQP